MQTQTIIAAHEKAIKALQLIDKANTCINLKSRIQQMHASIYGAEMMLPF